MENSNLDRYADAQEESTAVQNQNGQNINIQQEPVNFDADAYKKIVEKSKKLGRRKRGTSVVPKYYEFSMSKALVEKQYQDALNKANTKAKKEKAEDMYNANLELTWERFLFAGFTWTDTKKGKIKAVLLQNETGLYINLGAQLVRVFESLNLSQGTEIEIEYVKEEANKNSEGTTKIYEVYLLDEDEEQEQE